MATVVDLTDQELADVKAFTQQPNNESAIRAAMAEYLRFARRMQLKSLSGKVQMEENWAALEANELRNGHDDAGSGAG